MYQISCRYVYKNIVFQVIQRHTDMSNSDKEYNRIINFGDIGITKGKQKLLNNLCPKARSGYTSTSLLIQNYMPTKSKSTILQHNMVDTANYSSVLNVNSSCARYNKKNYVTLGKNVTSYRPSDMRYKSMIDKNEESISAQENDDEAVRSNGKF